MLTSLELFGFKSFADRTLFEFSPGITCVVGPNGSGKSNVVDAIKWILGDQSPKSLRGKEMADVIFNGSSGRKASGFSEATLAFDNSAGLFPLEAGEVRFGRRLYRSGDSEYLLNGASVRLKDIKDLFLGTGAGTAAYSIIEQGRVDQILQANPTTRRIVFEEAAGISRYKSRKVEAERKLEKVAQNLLRLTDIVDEVEAQLTATRSQASKAAKFRELSLELKALWTGLAADDFRVLSRRLDELTSGDLAQQHDLEQLTGDIDAIAGQKAELDQQLSRLEVELHRHERRIAGLREQIAAAESTIRHQTTRDAELVAEIDRLRTDRLALIQEAAAVSRELRETTERLTAFEQRLAAQRQALAEREMLCAKLQDELSEHEAWIAQRRRERDSARQQIAASDRQMLRLASQLESLEQSLAGLSENLERLQTQASAAEELLKTRRNEAAAVEERHRTALEAMALARQRDQQLRDEMAALEQSQASRRERRSAAVARIHVLEDLELRQEGISIGVRDILRRAHDSPHPPWNEIIGGVCDLLQVSLEHAPLVELALGSRSQLIVVRRQAPLVDYLNRQSAPISGRVGFLELASSKARVPARQPVDLSGASGIVCRIDELVEEIPEAAGLCAQLLADTWVTESLDAAVGLAAEHPGQRFVTRQGELIDADGAVYAGSVPHTTALVSRRSELRDLKHEIIRVDRELEQGAERLERLAAEIAEAHSTLADIERSTRAEHEQLAQVRSRAEEQAREVERAAAEQQQLAERCRAQAQQQAALQAQSQAAQAGRQALQQQLEAIDADLAAAQARMADVSAQLDAVREELKGRQLELARHNERVSSLRDMLARLNTEQEQRVSRRRQADARLDEMREALRQARLTILATRSGLDERFLQVEALAHHVADINLSRRDVRSTLASVAAEEDQLHRRRRAIEEERHAVEMRMRESRHQLASLNERIQEEFQQPLEEFVTQGASAFRNHLAQQPGDDSSASALADGALEELYDRAPIPFAQVRGDIEEQVSRLRRKLKLLGSVNTDALQELDELELRFAQLSSQLQDLQEAKGALEDIIRRINKESRRIFLETFDSIRANFRELFRKVFGGGEGDVILEDPENVLECGIDIVARPPGKELRSITLLSGGEKTMTAVALLFAMFKSKPSPYCILDEVDAALDDANVDRYVSVVKEFAQNTQFVIITHRKRTMTAANVLYGVTMEQAGVSKRMSVRFEDVSDDGHFRARPEAA